MFAGMCVCQSFWADEKHTDVNKADPELSVGSYK